MANEEIPESWQSSGEVRGYGRMLAKIEVVFRHFIVAKQTKQVERPFSPYESTLIRLRFADLCVWREL